jgi:lipopolysaccharide biosynthesis protein
MHPTAKSEPNELSAERDARPAERDALLSAYRDQIKNMQSLMVAQAAAIAAAATSRTALEDRLRISLSEREAEIGRLNEAVRAAEGERDNGRGALLVALARVTELEVAIEEKERQKVVPEILLGQAYAKIGELQRSSQEFEAELSVLADRFRELRRRFEAQVARLARLTHSDYAEKLPAPLTGLRALLPKRGKRLRRLARDYRLVASSPLFDAQWYRANNPDVAATNIDAVLHYLENGASEGRPPGPDFDPAAYLAANPDVAASGEKNPLRHYLLLGRQAERRLSIDTPVRGAPDEVQVRSSKIDFSLAVPFQYATDTRVTKLRVAAIFHIFYEELAIELRRYLQNVPVPADVYISTTNGDKKRIIEDVFSDWTLGTVDVRVTVNRGRDVAPTLVAFRQVYDTYDIVLHLHSKKSPQSDTFSAWRHYLFETLAGSPAIVNSVLSAFEENKTLGMISASHFGPVREWVSWGSNWESAAKLAMKLGFRIEPTADLEFPSGSMFWARSAALGPLLELGLTEEDFEAEQDQRDGTLAHALERLFFYTCERAGYTWVTVSRPDLLLDASTTIQVTAPTEVDRFFHTHNLRLLRASDCRFREPKSRYVPAIECKPLKPAPVRLVAFYLPQFHAIPENDMWWGEGFTEWTNVRPAKPLFVGHYQPHVPVDLGYYNLLEHGVMRRQIDLAKTYGIEAFCFYYYWFSGTQLLDKPIRQLLLNRDLNIPFCLCWANENWTRRWDGLDNEILIQQQHSIDDDINFIQSVAAYMRDERYVRLEGKPLLLVYRPKLLPSVKYTAERWRNWCREDGIGEIYLAYTQSFESTPPETFGFDAAIEFPPNNISPTDITNTVTAEDGEFEVYDWKSLMERSYHYERPDYMLFRSVCPMWDNTPRKKNRANVFVNNTPEFYEQWLKNAIEYTLKSCYPRENRLIFINAWNEWGEGAHLEPDAKNGYAYLCATRQALEAFSLSRAG